MPALTNVVLTDRTPVTPVAHTFSPSGFVGGVGTLAENSGMKLGESTFSISRKKSANNRYKPAMKLVIPVIVNETINGVTVPSIARVAIANVEFSFDEKSTKQERDNLVGMLYNSLAKGTTFVDKVAVDLEDIWQ